MEKFDWKIRMKTLLFLFKISGLWPEDSYTFDLYTAYTATCFVIFGFFHNFAQTIQVFLEPMDLKALAGTLFIASQAIAAWKAYFYIKHVKVIKKLLIKLDEDNFQPRNQRQRDLVKSDLEIWWKIYIGYQVSLASTCFLWLIFPILDQTYKKSRLPFVGWYPYNYKISPFYEITYGYQVTSLSFLNIWNSNLDMFSLHLMIYIGSQCDILCDNLRFLRENGKRNEPNSFQKALIAIIEHHKEVLSYANDYNVFVDKILLVQFFTSVCSVALSLFQLTLIVPFTSEFFSVISYIVSLVFQIFLYCWYGNEIDLRSNKITYAAFESGWIGISAEAQRTLLIFLLQTQRQITITTFKLFPLSLETFMKIMKSGFSYFAVLNQVNAPQT